MRALLTNMTDDKMKEHEIFTILDRLGDRETDILGQTARDIGSSND